LDLRGLMPKKKKTAIKKITGKKRTSAKKTAVGKSPESSSPSDKLLREHLLYLLRDGERTQTSITPSAIGRSNRGREGREFPAHRMDAARTHAHRPVGHPRIQPQSRHKSPPWPEGYWPEAETPQARRRGRIPSARSRRTSEPWSSWSPSANWPICKAALGRWTDHSARGAAGSRPQLISPGPACDAAQMHRNLECGADTPVREKPAGIP